MSHELDHEDARLGGFVLHGSGCIYWGPPKQPQETEEPAKTHHMSWLDDSKQRCFSPLLEVLCVPEEVAQCKQLAARFDGSK